jgi:hypothetical protein
MSNRIVGSRITNRIELDAWAARISRWDGLMIAARGWLRQEVALQDVLALSPHIRRDLGLADVVAARDGMLDFETRHLGF